MTDREMLDHFSDVLISDPRLLSLQERELLSNLRQLTHRINDDNTVAETIARAVGETVAGRMHEALACGGAVIFNACQGWIRSSSA
jgi:hypothetical protein